jgi:hypothetical protein
MTILSFGFECYKDKNSMINQQEKFLIKAEVHSDDYAVEITFDAVEWFEQASDADITALMKCDFGGDYAADAVADFFRNGVTKPLFFYLAIHPRSPGGSHGFECYVDSNQAETWIEANRSWLQGS